MTLLCPACGAAVTAANGPSTACPKCGAAVAVPTAYAPTVQTAAPAPPGGQWTADRPAPPPGFIPPKADVPASEPRAVAEHRGDERNLGVCVPPAVLAWVPLAGLILAVVFACFPWVGAYPGGVRVFSQNGWEAWTGSYTANTLAEAVPDLKAADAALKATVNSSAVLWLYFPLLLLSLAAAVADRVLKNPDATTLPGPLAWLPRVWPVRHRVLAVAAAVLLGLAVIEDVRGFGLESAVRGIAAGKVEADVKAADTDNAKVITRVKAGMEAGRFQIAYGNAVYALLAAHAAVLLAAGYRAWRGPDATPRLDVSV